MRRFNDVFEAVSTTVEETLEIPVEMAISASLPELLDVFPSKADGFLVYQGTERGVSLESSFAGLVHKFMLFIRKTKFNLKGIDPVIKRIISIFENTSGVLFEVNNRTYTLFFDSLDAGQIVQGEYLITITIEVIG